MVEWTGASSWARAWTCCEFTHAKQTWLTRLASTTFKAAPPCARTRVWQINAEEPRTSWIQAARGSMCEVCAAQQQHMVVMCCDAVRAKEQRRRGSTQQQLSTFCNSPLPLSSSSSPLHTAWLPTSTFTLLTLPQTTRQTLSKYRLQRLLDLNSQTRVLTTAPTHTQQPLALRLLQQWLHLLPVSPRLRRLRLRLLVQPAPRLQLQLLIRRPRTSTQRAALRVSAHASTERTKRC